jgi:hypothetical protein
MGSTRWTLVPAMLAAACAVAQQPAARDGAVRAFGVSLKYDPADFAGETVKREARLTHLEIGTDIPEGVAPLRTTIVLKGTGANRQRESEVEIVPLRDPSVPNFAKAYPELQRSAATLRAALARAGRPDPKLLEKADWHTIDSEHSLHTRVEHVEGAAISGFVFLAQYTQEDRPDPANNGQLLYVFLGLARDGSHFVQASFAVSHPALPRDVDAANGVARDAAGRYLRQDEKRLAAFDESSFQPSLAHLKALVRSIAFGPANSARATARKAPGPAARP